MCFGRSFIYFILIQPNTVPVSRSSSPPLHHHEALLTGQRSEPGKSRAGRPRIHCTLCRPTRGQQCQALNPDAPHIECSSKLTSKSNFTNSHVVASARMLAGASTASNSVASCRSSWGSRQQVAVTCSFPFICSLLHAHASSCVVGGTTELEPELAEETWKAQALKSYRLGKIQKTRKGWLTHPWTSMNIRVC